MGINAPQHDEATEVPRQHAAAPRVAMSTEAAKDGRPQTREQWEVLGKQLLYEDQYYRLHPEKLDVRNAELNAAVERLGIQSQADVDVIVAKPAAQRSADEQCVAAYMEDIVNLPLRHQAHARAELTTHGWPSTAERGRKYVEAFWLICQHADNDPALQRQALEKLLEHKHDAPNDIELWPAMYLLDRISTPQGYQYFGSQNSGEATRQLPPGLQMYWQRDPVGCIALLMHTDASSWPAAAKADIAARWQEAAASEQDRRHAAKTARMAQTGVLARINE